MLSSLFLRNLLLQRLCLLCFINHSPSCSLFPKHLRTQEQNLHQHGGYEGSLSLFVNEFFVFAFPLNDLWRSRQVSSAPWLKTLQSCYTFLLPSSFLKSQEDIQFYSPPPPATPLSTEGRSPSIAFRSSFIIAPFEALYIAHNRPQRTLVAPSLPASMRFFSQVAFCARLVSAAVLRRCPIFHGPTCLATYLDCKLDSGTRRVLPKSAARSTVAVQTRQLLSSKLAAPGSIKEPGGGP